MLIKEYEYNGYKIELFEHPIYHDFEFVVKTLDEKEAISTNKYFYECLEDAENAAQLNINTF